MAFLVTREELLALAEEVYELSAEYEEEITDWVVDIFLEDREEYLDPDDPLGVMWAAAAAAKDMVAEAREETETEVRRAAREITPVGSVADKLREAFGS